MAYSEIKEVYTDQGERHTITVSTGVYDEETKEDCIQIIICGDTLADNKTLWFSEEQRQELIAALSEV